MVALLYGLTPEDLAHVFETFHEPWVPGSTMAHPTLGNFNDRLKTTLHHYKDWTRKAFPTAYQQLKPIIGLAGEGDKARRK